MSDREYEWEMRVAVTMTSLVALLLEKGVFTEAEWRAMQCRLQAVTDQVEAAVEEEVKDDLFRWLREEG